MKKIAIIGGGYMAGIFAQNARQMNVESHCFSLKEGIVDESLYDYIHYVNILDKNKVLDICNSLNIDGVVATTELTISVAAYVAECMRLNGISHKVAEVITDKYRNRMITNAIEELNNPSFLEVYSVDDVKNLDFKYPIILKPTSKGGKRGITVIYEKEEIESAFDYALKGASGKLPLIAEEFIDGGMECSVESLSYHGSNYIVQVTEKVTSGAPHCVELAHHQPANLSEEDRKRVESAVIKGLSAIGLSNGPCHTEVKIKDGTVYLIEFNARPGGDHIAYPLTELSTGYPYIKAAIKIALNQFDEIDFSKFSNKKAGVLFVTEQTSELKCLYDHCEEYDWFYKKNEVTDELITIEHNDGFNINYFMYLSDERPNFVHYENY